MVVKHFGNFPGWVDFKCIKTNPVSEKTRQPQKYYSHETLNFTQSLTTIFIKVYILHSTYSKLSDLCTETEHQIKNIL